MLELEDVHAYYGKSHALQGISLRVERSEIVSLLGRNGAGKTTTFNTIMGFVRSKRGKIKFNGNNIENFRPYEIARLGIGYVPQGRFIIPEFTVEENMRLACITGKMNPEVLSRVYDLFPFLRERLKQWGGTLSGGQQQMLAIARAMMQEPKIIFMDEPTEGLQPSIIKDIKKAISYLKRQGISILLVDQIAKMALELSDRVYIIEKGLIQFSGAPDELSKNNQILLQYLGVKINDT